MVESWLRLPPERALKYLANKVSIPAEELSALTNYFHDWAFTVANLNSAEILDAIKFLLTDSLQRGGNLDTFNKQFDRLVERMGWSANGNRRRIIYQTNISQAYRYGRQKEIDRLIGDNKSDWVLVWRHRDSPNFRILHKQLHNKAIPADHNFWKYGLPPCGFGCRCTVFALRKERAKKQNIEIITNPPNPDTIWDRQFRRSPIDAKELMREALPKLSPSLREQVEQRIREKIDD